MFPPGSAARQSASSRSACFSTTKTEDAGAWFVAQPPGHLAFLLTVPPDSLLCCATQQQQERADRHGQVTIPAICGSPLFCARKASSRRWYSSSARAISYCVHGASDTDMCCTAQQAKQGNGEAAHLLGGSRGFARRLFLLGMFRCLLLVCSLLHAMEMASWLCAAKLSNPPRHSYLYHLLPVVTAIKQSCTPIAWGVP